MDLSFLLMVAMPVAMIAAAIATWRIARRDNTHEPDSTVWRDDSLDDWRRDRDAAAEARRAERAGGPPADAGATEERSETRHNQRIGG